METNDLIKALATDTRRQGLPLGRAWIAALVVAVLVAAVVFFALLGPRPDAGAALSTVRFVFKFIVTVALAVAAYRLAVAVSRPGGNWRAALSGLLVAPLLLVLAVLLELVAVPSTNWAARLIGTNSMVCLTFVPLIGVIPLVVLLLAMRHGAPANATTAGAVSGLLAGGIAAAFYAAHCPDDSPLFVAVWYPLAIAILVSLGALLGRFFLRW
ncbi:NrsF family protein [Rhizobium sp. TRM96647]|uniref:NrsF family protein n=1 Tax=unclassified Rhizobium TaxID=2613769 RepID=UPI0021E9ADC1|nr:MULTISPECIES: NrsF family protein [unclassified Rhizobium]MCV3737997.1 NrsF family protein [Rhizobium sp. TRM96647]MCV3759684.1 NrsF family protein [Rhizobium sp. TRM96650]